MGRRLSSQITGSARSMPGKETLRPIMSLASHLLLMACPCRSDATGPRARGSAQLPSLPSHACILGCNAARPCKESTPLWAQKDASQKQYSLRRPVRHFFVYLCSMLHTANDKELQACKAHRLNLRWTDLHAGLLTTPQSSLCFIFHPLCSLPCAVLVPVLLPRRAIRSIPTQGFPDHWFLSERVDNAAVYSFKLHPALTGMLHK